MMDVVSAGLRRKNNFKIVTCSSSNASGGVLMPVQNLRIWEGLMLIQVLEQHMLPYNNIFLRDVLAYSPKDNSKLH